MSNRKAYSTPQIIALNAQLTDTKQVPSPVEGQNPGGNGMGTNGDLSMYGVS
jgi:hypothetical protein